MAVEAQLPTIATIVVTGAIDSVNPCAIGVLILMVSVLLAMRKNMKQIFMFGLLYIAAVFATYLLAGIGLLYGLSQVPLVYAEYISIFVSAFVIAAGVLEIKDFFWYGQGFSLAIPHSISKKLDKYASNATIPGIIFLGVFVAAVELPCTGAPYLAIITLLSQYFDFTAFMLLVLYNLIFISPLLVILIMIATGKKVQEIKKWKQDTRHYMRLFIGLILVAMGWLLILIANGTINLG